MNKRALLVGGTGPTGPHVACGLLERGYALSILNRGLHVATGLPPHEHIRADPHFRETLAAALRGREFDLVVATYGRIRHLAALLAGRCGHFISVGGVPAYIGMFAPWKLRPFGVRIPAREHEGMADQPAGDDEPAAKFSHSVWASEQEVMKLHRAGAFNATHFRYPFIYGPRQPHPQEWSIVRRVLDRRPFMILPDGGLEIPPRCSARNAAHTVLLAVDNPQVAAGQVYNCADDDRFTWRQIVETVVEIMGGTMQMFSLPDRLALPARALSPMQEVSSHCVLDTTKIRTQLGYRDVVSARVALEETVSWLIECPPSADSFERDSFDYQTEDRLMDAYSQAVLQIERTVVTRRATASHMYARPKQPRA